MKVKNVNTSFRQFLLLSNCVFSVFAIMGFLSPKFESKKYRFSLFTLCVYIPLTWFGLVWLIAVGTTVTQPDQPETHTYILLSKHNHLSYHSAGTSMIGYSVHAHDHSNTGYWGGWHPYQKWRPEVAIRVGSPLKRVSPSSAPMTTAPKDSHSMK